MKHKHLTSLLQSNYTTVGVIFHPHIQPPSSQNRQQVYTYKTRDLTLKEGDHAIVEKQGALSVVTIVRVDAEPQLDLDADFEYKWLVQRVDLAAYIAANEREAQLSKQLQRIEQESQRRALLQKMFNGLDENAKRELDQLIEQEGGTLVLQHFGEKTNEPQS